MSLCTNTIFTYLLQFLKFVLLRKNDAKFSIGNILYLGKTYILSWRLVAKYPVILQVRLLFWFEQNCYVTHLTNDSHWRDNTRILAVFGHLPTEPRSDVQEGDGELSEERNNLEDHDQHQDEEVLSIRPRSLLEGHHQSISYVIQAEWMSLTWNLEDKISET